jgi:hypothetical protein
VPTDRLVGRAARVRLRSSRRSADAVPKNCPKTVSVGAEDPVESEQIEYRASGPSGAQLSQRGTTASAADQGNEAKKYDALVTGWVRKRKPVTTPKLPPPPPRMAQ